MTTQSNTVESEIEVLHGRQGQVDETIGKMREAFGGLRDRIKAIEDAAGGGEEPTFPVLELPPLPQDTKPRVAYLKALCAFQGEALALPKDKPGANYKYTDLASSLSTLRPLLTKHGLILTFRAWTVEARYVAVIAVLEHVDGWYSHTQLAARVEDAMTRTKSGGWSMNHAQGQGAIQTYLQRYSMMALLGLTAALDTDGVADPEAVRDDTPPAGKGSRRRGQDADPDF